MTTFGVYLNATHVGELGDLPDGRIGFRFADSYRNMVRRPVLGQRFEDDLERTYAGRSPGQLPAFFANLLPDGQLRSVIEKSLGIDGCSDLLLLAAVEKDLPGAVRVQPREGDTTLTANGGGGEEHVDHGEEQLGLRFSLAGAQLKFSLIKEGNRFTLPAHDAAGQWIVKVAMTGYQGLAENEHFVLEWARRAGFDVPECHLVPSSQLSELSGFLEPGSQALAVRRYDRVDGARIHQEDFNQILGKQPRVDGSEKYEATFEQVGVLLNALIGGNAAREFLRRAVFVIASGNNDSHLKNWSLLYADGIHAQLAPLYDQVATVAWPKLDRRLALKLSGARDFGRVSRESLLRLGRRLGLTDDESGGIVDETRDRIRDAWEQLRMLDLLAEHRQAIRDHWSGVPFLRGGDLFARGIS
jgi:serine/threonine-protein kinase HipA